MKIRIALIIIIISTISCGLNKKEKKMNNIDYKEKLYDLSTNESFLNDFPFYFIKINSSSISCKTTINNVLFKKYYSYSKDLQGIHFINHYIKNKNKIKLHIAPVYDTIFEKTNDFINIKVYKSPSKKIYTEDDFFTSAEEVINFDTYAPSNKKKIIYENIEGLPYFEKEFEFEAEMPFENEALINSKNLQEIDKKVLEQKVLKQYQRFVNSVKNKDENTYWELYYHKVAYFAKANFLTEEEIEDLIKEGEIYYEKMSYQPIENYEMVFYDEGRLVCFESKSNELEFKGKSPLIATAVNPNDPNDVFRNPIQFYFYMPKDSNELKIMY